MYTVDPVTAQVLFLSDSVARAEQKGVDEEGQTLGGGCGKFYDITKSYLKLMKEKGIN